MFALLLWLLEVLIVFSSCAYSQQNLHIIVFDAGSTGTRLHLYDFKINSGQLVLTNELYESITPGLSAYAENPESIRKPLENLLSKAKDTLPESERSKTPLSLGATAGLRLLPKNKADRILEICRDVFSHSEFMVSNSSVSMLDESDEGIYCWVTVNYLLETFSFESSDVLEKSAVLDLGGGSTQITMTVSDDFMKNAKPDVRRNIYNLTLSDRPFSVYTKSILGMGLMAARKKILCLLNECPDENVKKAVKIESDCLVTENSNTIEWIYMGQKFEIRGTNVTEKFVKCFNIVKQVVLQDMPNDLPSLKGQKIIGTSYYVDRAAEAQAIESGDGGDLYVKNFYDYAGKLFNYPDDNQPFLGLDLVYIYSLLHDGLKVNDDTLITVLSMLYGYEVSWTLGNAVQVLRDEGVNNQLQSLHN